MRKTVRRAVVLYIFAAVFFAAVVLLVVSFALNGSDWVSNRVNKHVYSSGQTVNAGKITDRNGEILAQSVSGERKFSKDPDIRRATIHIVGDTSGFISTGTHSLYRDSLSGYSFAGGLYKLKTTGSGTDIALNIDASVCKAAYLAFGSYNGAAAAYNYKTGELLCSVSKPTYDVYNIPADILTNEKYDGVYLDKVVSGLYTPGSVMKIITAACAIENIPDLSTRTFTCRGQQQFSDGVVKCLDTHGNITFEQAFTQSCNCAFSALAVELGPDKLKATAAELGFNTRNYADGVRLSISSYYPSTTSQSELGWAGIGQSTTMVNPCHMLCIAGAVANSGTAVLPKRVKSSSVLQLANSITDTSSGISLPQPVADKLRQMMKTTVAMKYGTGRFPGLSVCGKTGTAQIDGKDSHSWFVGFSDDPEFPVAVVCVAENAGAGAGTAINVSNTILQNLKKNRSY